MVPQLASNPSKNRAKLSLLMLVLAIPTSALGVFSGISVGEDQSQRRPGTNTLEVHYGNTSTQPFRALVELFHGGKRLRAKQLRAGHGVVWKDLDDGDYEVHCSAVNHGTSVYRVLVSGQDVDDLSVDVGGEGPFIVGGGPTVLDLTAEVEALRKVCSELEARLEKLEGKVAEVTKTNQL